MFQLQMYLKFSDTSIFQVNRFIFRNFIRFLENIYVIITTRTIITNYFSCFETTNDNNRIYFTSGCGLTFSALFPLDFRQICYSVLLLFLGIGILFGSEGIGGIPFDNPPLAKSIGLVALIFIIFSGGLDTGWPDTKPIFWQGIVLSTFGVLLTAIITGFFAVYILDFSVWEGMLLGSIVSSTDAAVVFSVLRSKRISLKKPLKPLLEFESGSNDPMALFLTIGFISLLTYKATSILSLSPFFYGYGYRSACRIPNDKGNYIHCKRLKLTMRIISRGNDFIEVVYSLYCRLLRGNGILAVYLTGLGLGQAEFPNKNYITKFNDGLSWICQIVMFVTLGLLVFLPHLVPLAGP